MGIILKHLINGHWSCGLWWSFDKPVLYIGRLPYDGWHYVLHIEPLWVECDEFPVDQK